MGPSGEALERLKGDGPGCRIIDDLSGRVLSKMGVKWAEEWLGAGRGAGGGGDLATLLPLRMTVWDYWSTLNDAKMQWVCARWDCGGGCGGCGAAWRAALVGVRALRVRAREALMVSCRSVFFPRRARRRSSEEKVSRERGGGGRGERARARERPSERAQREKEQPCMETCNSLRAFQCVAQMLVICAHTHENA